VAVVGVVDVVVGITAVVVVVAVDTDAVVVVETTAVETPVVVVVVVAAAAADIEMMAADADIVCLLRRPLLPQRYHPPHAHETEHLFHHCSWTWHPVVLCPLCLVAVETSKDGSAAIHDHCPWANLSVSSDKCLSLFVNTRGRVVAVLTPMCVCCMCISRNREPEG